MTETIIPITEMTKEEINLFFKYRQPERETAEALWIYIRECLNSNPPDLGVERAFVAIVKMIESERSEAKSLALEDEPPRNEADAYG